MQSSPKGRTIRPPLARAAAGRGRRQQSGPYAAETGTKSFWSCDFVAVIAYLVLGMCIMIFGVTLNTYLTNHDTNGGHVVTTPAKPGLVKPTQLQPLPIPQTTPTLPPDDIKQATAGTDKTGSSKDQFKQTDKQSQQVSKPTKKPTSKPKGGNKDKQGNSNSLAIIDHGPEPHIQMIHGEKDGTIKQDMRVVLFDNDVTELPPVHRKHAASIAGFPYEYSVTVERLSGLPLFKYQQDTPTASLEATMEFMSEQPQCADKPIFLSMASVGDDLYWQLIENFVYTMVKFSTVECSLVICVSDAKCMSMCNSAHFPCFNFKSEIKPLPSVMEQIGEVKLFHVPKALAKGVDVFMLDLDVGFLNDPMAMVRAFYATPHIDIMVQEDLIFIMNRTKAGWKTWFTQPLPNIGLFLCRGNEKTARVFDIAWSKYTKMEDVQSKSNPGKDQNHVLEAMRIGRGTFGLRYAYFSNSTAMLLDKVVLNVDRSVELGGAASGGLLASEHTLASHTTCYEHTTKVLGLKATNAFWHPRYYDALRPTITKPILWQSAMQVLDEVRSLLWLGLATGRAVIIPNLLGPEETEKSHRYQGHAMWPGFRVAKIKREKGVAALKVDILEPAFYWRVQRDYDDAPEPYVVTVKPSDTAVDIRDTILALGSAHPRVVLYTAASASRLGSESKMKSDEERLIRWAKDSVGAFDDPYSVEAKRYKQLPSVKDVSRNTP